jgi:phospholipase C
MTRLTTVLALAALAHMPASGTAATGTIQDVQHVIILMQENRSFDHYYGSFHGVRGFSDANALVFPNGQTDFYQPSFTNYILPYHVTNQCLIDVDHHEDTMLDACNGGKWDSYISAKSPRTMQYYTRDDIAYYYALAEAYTLCDEYHASYLGETYPNRLYMMTGTIDPHGLAGGPQTNNWIPTNGLGWTTYAERLQSAGISWRVYQESYDYFPLDALLWFTNFMNRPVGDPLHDRTATVPDLLKAFQSDVQSNTLPAVSWIMPWWSHSEHPFYSPSRGEYLVSLLLNILMSNPAVYNSTVFIITYDEDGGFFDHVPSPLPPPGTPDESVNGGPIGLGARVPTILISPWSRGGYVASEIFDHTSILRFLEQWTGVHEPNISAWRRKVCGDLTSAFDFAHPDTSLPALPVVAPINCNSPGFDVEPPPFQTFPVQETGTNRARPRPYGPNAFTIADCGHSQLGITMTNAGTASTHFMIYANAFRPDGPWQYDVDPHTSLTAYFNVSQSAGAYDFTCYGPHRFHRRYAGNIHDNCNQLDVTSSADPNAASVTLAMRNSSAVPVTFTVTNLFQPGALRTYTVPAGSTATDTFAFVANNSAAYSLQAGLSSDGSFLRTFTGDPDALAPAGAGTSPPPFTTNVPPVVTNLTAIVSGPYIVVAYPSGASGMTLQYSTNLAPNSWQPVPAQPSISGTNIYVAIPTATARKMFFRLR